MSALRKLERNVAKSKGISWSDFRKKKYIVEDEEGNIISDLTPRNTMKKKKPHFDNCEQYFNMFNYFDKLKAEAKEKETV